MDENIDRTLEKERNMTTMITAGWDNCSSFKLCGTFCYILTLLFPQRRKEIGIRKVVGARVGENHCNAYYRFLKTCCHCLFDRNSNCLVF